MASIYRNFRRSSSLKVSTDSMISRAMKLDTNEHTFRVRTTRKDAEHFWNRSVRKPYEKSICEGTFMCEPIENDVMPNELS